MNRRMKLWLALLLYDMLTLGCTLAEGVVEESEMALPTEDMEAAEAAVTANAPEHRRQRQ